MSGRDANQLERELACCEQRKAELWSRLFRAEDALGMILIEYELNEDVPSTHLVGIAKAGLYGKDDDA